MLAIDAYCSYTQIPEISHSELLNAIEKLDLEICYKDDPCKPFLLYTNSIKADPYNYLTYQKITEAPEKKTIKLKLERTKLVKF